MSPWPDDLIELGNAVRQRALRLGSALHFSATTQSTNDDAKRGAREGAAHGSVWLADWQEAGRGRQGRSFLSPAGDNVLMSILVRGRFAPRFTPLAALVSGLATRHAVAALLPGRSVQVKWPNDVLVDGRKIAGVLVEAQSRGSALDSLVIGIGVNVHTRSFPEEIAARATSVALAGGDAERARVVIELLAYLDQHLEPVLSRGLGALHAELARYDALVGLRVESESGVGLAEGIDDEGRLVVRDDAGNSHAWSYGEVHLGSTTA